MEISQVSDPSNDSPDMVDPQPLPSDFDPKTMRRTKPGCKRLILTLSVLIAFLLGFPFLWKSVDIYRAPLPFSDIDALSAQIESNPLQFPCHFQAIFVGFNSEHLKASKIRSSLIHEMTKMSPKSPQCGSCISNYTVSVVLDSGFECVQAPDAKPSDSWRCGAINAIDFGDALEFGDDKVDEFLESVLGGSLDSLAGGMVYNAVVMNRDEPLRSVVGKYRHAWVLGRVLEVDAIARAAEIFVKVFVNGGKEEGLIPGEFMPVGPDGKIVLSFNLLNADPDDWIYDWDFQRVDEILLTPTVEALAPITNITVESQVLYHTPKASFSFWDDKLNSYILSTNDLPFFVNSNEWHLDTSIAASGRSKILQFVVYIPSSKECPLLLQLPDGGISSTNSFISPMWGGVIIWNPEGCPSGSESKHPLRHLISPQDLHKVVEILMGQFRQLFGLKSDMLYVGESGTLSLLASKKGFTKWELDFLSRKHSCFNLHSCATTLGSLSRLVQSLPRMIIKDEIGKQVRYSIEAANLAQSNASLGVYDASALSSRQARSLAEDAFFHPSIMSVSYYSFEHCFAVYSPFFLPVSLHVLLAAVREWRRYKQETNKYLVWKKAEVST